MHLTTEAGDPVAPVLFEEDSLGLSPTIVLPEPLPDEDDGGDDYGKVVHLEHQHETPP